MALCHGQKKERPNTLILGGSRYRPFKSLTGKQLRGYQDNSRQFVKCKCLPNRLGNNFANAKNLF